ncbi:hypothetical protein F0562_015783 [Nyssa sinensis]|uniref:DNA damage-binding protein 1 n=1 Tax=Nyssa sinensis TaxID=561372 RepID=A0A5J4ZKM5_9ASTE|nr:hypothetical protein F0562_015783 [Nyssa sinensis]
MAVSEEESSSAKSRSTSNGVHYLAKCVLRGSVVLQVVQGHIRSPSSKDVVFGKETSIELVIIDEDGIVKSYLPQIPGKDILAVLSDSGKLSFLTFSNEMHRFFPLTHIQLSAPGNLRDQIGRMLAVDSNGCFIAASAYEDQLALFSVAMSAGSNIIDKRILYPTRNEGDSSTASGVTSICGTIWSMCFISKEFPEPSKEHNPVLAIIMNRRGSFLNELLLLEWNTREHTVHVISQVGDALLMDLRDAHHPSCVYKMSLNFLPPAVEEHNFIEESCRVHDGDEEGIFNVAASALLELSDMVKDDDPMSIDGISGSVKSTSEHVCSWSWEPGNGKIPRMIFCVDSGELFMIEISFDSDGLKVDLSESLYKGLPCNALLWVEGGFLAALVEMGDGMVLKLEEGRLFYRSPIQNIAPILDNSIVDCHDEKQDQMFACCGMAPEGSLRIIQSGIGVEKLLKTAPTYQGITGTWTVKMKLRDSYHSFLVLSFVEETRVLSVGVSFTDVTDTVGFQPDVCTLACGLVGDGLLVQIYQNAIRLCLPTTAAHPEGIPFSSPYELSCISVPQNHFEQKPSASRISLVDNNLVAALPVGVEIGNCFAIGTHKPSVEILSFVPDEGLRVLAIGTISLTSTMGTAVSGCVPQDVRLVLVDRLYVLSGLRNGMLLRFEWPAASTMSSFESSSLRPCYSSCMVNLDNALSKTTSSQICIYNLSETMKDGPVYLQLIAIRRIGITPTFLIPLSDSLDSDIIALSDRPWLLQTARHSLSYTSISFQPSTHLTPVCSVECPKGVLFVAENSLHLVEMVHSKRLNVQKFHLGGTPRKVLYHSESRLLLVMRTELSNDAFSSDICCVDPVSGSVLSSFKLEPGETGKSMELVRVGNDQVLVIGTSLSAGPAIMPSGEAESSTKGRLIVLCLEHRQNSDSGSMTFCSKAGSSSQQNSPFREIVGYAAEQLSSSSLCSSPDDNSCDGIKLEETEAWHLRVAYATVWPGMVLAICPYLDRYFLASAGNVFYVCGFPNDNSQRVRRLAVGRTRFMIMTLTANFTRIAVGDCRDGILFYTYHEDARKLEQLYCDPGQRLVADCILMDVDTAIVSDRKGSIAVLSRSNHLEDNASPECNLTQSCSYYMGEIAMSLWKGSFSFKLPTDDILKGYDSANTIIDLSHNSIMASTLLGSIIVLIPISREEHELLAAVQARLAVHPLTAPILGNDHNEFRSRESLPGVPKILDGDMLAQFLELTSLQQEAILGLPLGSPDTVMLSSKPSSPPITVNQVVRLLERVHYVLN